MRPAMVCGHTLVVPDSVADWDAVAGDSPWERARLTSMLTTLQPDDVVYDIGAEHGWMSVILGLRVGGANMVLVEPSQEFWPNIRMGWEENDLSMPLACVQGFAGARSDADVYVRTWPPSSVGPECGAMAYRHSNHHADSIKTASIDQISRATGRPPKGITVDVEGAELSVMAGAKVTLINDRPHVWISVHEDLMHRDFGTSPEQLDAFMEDHGYRKTDLGYDHEQHVHYTPKEWR